VFHHAGSGRCIARSLHSIGGKLGTMSGIMSDCVGISADLIGSQAYESKEIAPILENLGIAK
jgi:hypothetical protein